jgi:hypothetical protein
MSEYNVKKEIKKILKSYDPLVTFFMPVQTGYGKNGVEDFCVCAFGKYLAIEAKYTKTSKQSSLQVLREGDVRAAGGIYIVIHNSNLDFLRMLLNRMEDLYNEAQARKSCTSAIT